MKFEARCLHWRVILGAVQIPFQVKSCKGSCNKIFFNIVSISPWDKYSLSTFSAQSDFVNTLLSFLRVWKWKESEVREHQSYKQAENFLYEAFSLRVNENQFESRAVTSDKLSFQNVSIEPKFQDLLLWLNCEVQPLNTTPTTFEVVVNSEFSCRIALDCTFLATPSSIYTETPGKQTYLAPINDINIYNKSVIECLNSRYFCDSTHRAERTT